MNQKESSNKVQIWKYGFALAVLLLGLIFSFFHIGKEFLGFTSVGSWLVYVSFVMLVVITLQHFSNKKRIVDERMLFVASKASRLTFVAVIIFAFFIMVLDGIKALEISYSLFMSYFVCGMLIVYLVSYKFLLCFY